MKTLFAAIIILLSSNFIYGQINLDQTGDGHIVIIHQIGENAINIEQSGMDQSVDIYQEGDLNIADAIQTEIPGAAIQGLNEAAITQIGNENQAEIHQLVGYDNFGEIEQTGDMNKASITQDVTYFNTAGIFQYGDNNEGSILQKQSEFTEAEITQKGDLNIAEINFDHPAYTLSNEKGSIYQEGNKNYARQNGGSTEQIGNYNNSEIKIEESADASKKGSGVVIQHQNFAKAKQNISSWNGSGEIYQTTLNPKASNYNEQFVGDNAQALANVNGENNYGSQIVGGEYDVSHIEQEGNNNTTTTIQYSESSAIYAQTIGKNSSYNRIVIEQAGSLNGSNDATVSIEGSYNTASIFQDGSLNNAGIFKSISYGIEIIGDYNTAVISQEGDENLARIYQKGNSNFAELLFIGDDIRSRIDQLGNDLYTSITIVR